MNKKWIALAAAVCLLFVAAAGVHGQLAKGTLAVSIDSASSESRMSAEDPAMMLVPVDEPNIQIIVELPEEETVIDEPVVEEPEVEEPVVDEPVVEEPEVEEPVVDEPDVEEPEVEEPVVDEPVVEEPEVEEPVVDEPVVEEPEVNEPEAIVPEELCAAISASAEYVNVGETFSGSVSVSGGVAPYQVELSVAFKEFTVASKNAKLEENESISISYTPAKGGTYLVYANVTDAAGSTATVRVEVGARDRSLDNKDDAKWVELAQAVELTGDWRMDVLLIAQSQLGYTENDTDFVVENGQNSGYTLYGEWVGNAYADWCAAFIGWCFDQADIDMNMRMASVSSWLSKMDNLGAFRTADYTPEAGDIVFIITDEDEGIGHIGLVEYVSGSVMGTIEANVGNMVDRRTYQLNESCIGGYGSMTALMDAAGVEYNGSGITYEVEDIEDFTGYLNTEKVNLRNGPSTKTMVKAVLEGVGTPVLVMGQVNSENEQWYLLQGEDIYGLQTGYMMAKFVDGTVPSSWEGYNLDLTVEEDGQVIVVDPYVAEVMAWAEATGATEEMVERALNATSLDSLVIEGNKLVYVRDASTIATYDAENGALVDVNTGLIVAYYDAETKLITPAFAVEEAANSEQ